MNFLSRFLFRKQREAYHENLALFQEYANSLNADIRRLEEENQRLRNIVEGVEAYIEFMTEVNDVA